MKSRNVLVCGATGQQGGSVIQNLLKDNHQVTGVTRNPNSEKARMLTKQGVRLISVDFTDQERMTKVMEPFDTVFAMTTPFEGGIETEIEQGITLVNAAHHAGIDHFIFNSVAGAHLSTGIPHFDSKYEVEKHLSTLPLPYTIVGPTYFMDNLFFPFMLEELRKGVLKMAMPEDRMLQQISVKDIGRFIGMVINHRDEMIGRRIDIAGDELTGAQAAEILSKSIGAEIRYEGFSPDYLRAQSEDLALMYEWFNQYGYTSDIEALRPYQFLDYASWAESQDWDTILK